jgi:hypothetical protein
LRGKLSILKKLLVPLFLLQALCPVFDASAQNPLVKMWDKTFGGLSDDEPTCFQPTGDGGFIIGGFSYSDAGGDKSEPLKNAPGIIDYWIVKIDSLGNKEWDRDLGGANGDQLNSLQQTADGGYIAGGSSASVISGDKTEASWGNWDYWILKLDAAGNILWDKDFGGTATDQLSCVRQTADGGYLLAGSSASGVSGDKTQPSIGALDFWIVKTDASGNKLWDKNFGGTDADKLNSISLTDDGGYILGGSSWSPVSGDKTEGCWGSEDYWIVKIDSLGNKEWDKDFGGTDSDILYSLVQTHDGGYLLGGRSGSDVSGNKSHPLWGGYDFWVVKINTLGVKEWDKSYGGTANEDEFGNISLTDDGGYLIAGTSYSAIGGAKTESNLGMEQSWFLKLDSMFSTQWDKTVFTACHDEIGMAVQTKDQCYAVVNSNGPSCSAGGYRSQASWNGGRDYWIVKFCDSTYFSPAAAAASSVQSLCPGTCTSFQNQSVNSISWQWNFPGATPDTSTAQNPSGICYHAPGSYDVVLIANSLHGADTLLITNFITVYPHAAPQGIQQSGDTLFANAGSTSYAWYYNGNSIGGATNSFYVALQDGDYNVICTDSNGCEAEAVIYNVVSGTDENRDAKEAEVFPNPFHDAVSITTAFPSVVSVKNLLGEEVFTAFSAGGQETKISLEFLPCGVYFLSVTADSKTSVKKIVRE